MTVPAPRGSAAVVRDEMAMRSRIVAALQTGPRTIPELAEALGAPLPELTHWVMALTRYGVLEALPKPKAEDYFRYGLSSENAAKGNGV